MKNKKSSTNTLVIAVLFIILVVLAVLLYTKRSTPVIQEIPISDNVVAEVMEGEVIKEEPVAICSEGQREILLDREVMALCLPSQIEVEGEQPVIGDKGVQVSVFFNDTSSLIYQTRDYQNTKDPSIVNFACLQNVSRLQWETCFNEEDELVTINDYQLESGLNAIEVTIDLQQAHDDRLQRNEFIFVPGVQANGKNYDVIIPIARGTDAQAKRLAESLTVIR